jgi:hypothetical protein
MVSMTGTVFVLPDGSRDDDGWLGDFVREPVVFSVHQTSPTPGDYRVLANDGAGPREICTLTDEPGSTPVWRGRWNNDEWCDWIETETRKLIAQPRRD